MTDAFGAGIQGKGVLMGWHISPGNDSEKAEFAISEPPETHGLKSYDSKYHDEKFDILGKKQ